MATPGKPESKMTQIFVQAKAAKGLLKALKETDEAKVMGVLEQYKDLTVVLMAVQAVLEEIEKTAGRSLKILIGEMYRTNEAVRDGKAGPEHLVCVQNFIKHYDGIVSKKNIDLLKHFNVLAIESITAKYQQTQQDQSQESDQGRGRSDTIYNRGPR